MSDKKTNVGCRLKICGTSRANANIVDDLKISDPEPDVGEQMIKNATQKWSEGDNDTKNS